MPGNSFQSSPPPLSATESSARANLLKDLTYLSKDIGERNSRQYEKLLEAAQFIKTRFEEAGFEPLMHEYKVGGKSYYNVEVTVSGITERDRIIVVGAHYDTVVGCPGADDNGTGIVSLLELARQLKGKKLARTVRLVAFPNEEQPFFWTDAMGSFVYARECRAKNEDILGMIAIETIGYYSDAPKSQHYPVPIFGLLPDKGNFVFFVANFKSRDFVRSSIEAFRRGTPVPSEGVAAYDFFDDISRSDNNSFWVHGYKGFMVTDSANFRNPHYHRATDTVETIDFDNLARVVIGLSKMLQELALEDI